MTDSEKVVADTQSSETPKAVELRETFWYTMGELVEMVVCPGCGISMVSFKNRFSHVKKCFSIKRRGPLYRIHGYAECKCGLLIADTAKAQKLHCCLGKLRPCKPIIPAEPKKPPAESPPPEESISTPIQNDSVQVLQPKSKTWIHNFITPIKQKDISFLDISYSNKPLPQPTTKPRVRNFDRPSLKQVPNEVCVYSIIRKNGVISVAGRSILKRKGSNENLVILKKRRLRLPAINQIEKA
ncbi:uncharacterized protein LOC108112640 isoform X2 [Drosophila eugracilis]|uniref:uncharacterized protein LOC108112640 isoform X2 n=1 Tax=Drosophila eugracilis TaxID=29029 RepID=UPI0007E64817|nr:uncharacterized protein LOC108112640 isoform X2 [Drosophila eugracilis]